jgi:hypothetical protein
MASTTNINELPMNPAGNSPNVSFIASENNATQMQGQAQPQSQQSMSLDQTTINQIVSGLQQASIAGATQLPSRDIPRSTENITNDEQIQPNYIQPASNNDYIKKEKKDDPENVVEKYIKTEHLENSLDTTYNEIQTPLLLIVLYFLFQLPIFKKTLFHYIPFLFSKDGNINLNGLAFMSITYGITYYFLNKTITQLNNI